MYCFAISSLLIFACRAAVEPIKNTERPTSPTLSLTPSYTPFQAQSPTNTPLPSPTEQSTLTPTATPQPSQTTAAPLRFAVIGDYGSGDHGEEDVANLVKSWSPEFIITTGDNNYPNGSAKTIDEHIGRYYYEFIAPYQGKYGQGAQINRFFPSLGNHDWDTDKAAHYFDYFNLPGNERYYEFTWGPVHLFALDSDSREPDGVGRSSVQAQWLQERLAKSESPWKIVYMHHPPYSSGLHGSIDWMRWPFKEWGATTVIAGHDHVYERLIINGFPYFINGLGGKSRYPFTIPLSGSEIRYNDSYGAMLVEANQLIITFQFINLAGEVIDTFTLYPD